LPNFRRAAGPAIHVDVLGVLVCADVVWLSVAGWRHASRANIPKFEEEIVQSPSVLALASLLRLWANMTFALLQTC
jgi:hypothetical protein